MKKYVAASVGILLFMFTNCAEPLPDLADDQASTVGPATDPASAGLSAGFGTPGEVVNPPLLQNTNSAGAAPAMTAPPAEDNSTTTLHRFYNQLNGQHFLSGNPTEAGSPWILDATTISVFRVSYNHRHPLYRCYATANGDHFSSNDSNCEGYLFEGLYGYVENGPTTVANRALYRCFSLSFGHMDSTNPAECTNNGFNVEGVMGYVP